MFESLTKNIGMKGWALLFVAFVVGIAIDGICPQADREFKPGDESYANMPTYDDWPGSWQLDSEQVMAPSVATSPGTMDEPRIGSLPSDVPPRRY
jgi:hypothetical protein